MDIRPSVQRKLIFFSTISGPIALAIVVLVSGFLIATRPPPAVNTYNAISESANAEFFAKKFFITWATGKGAAKGTGQSSQEKYLAGYIDPNLKVPLNSDPVRLTGLSVVNVTPTLTNYEGVTEWAFTLSATMIVPGGATVTNDYRLTFISRGQDYQILVLPYPIPSTVSPIKVESQYGGGVDLNSVLAKRVEGFLKGYLAQKNTRVDISGYLTSDFKTSPVADSPYSSIQITSIANGGNEDLSDSADGTEADILVTLRAYISTATFTTIQMPLRVVKPKDGQWAVAGITEPVNFGEVSAR